MRSPDEDGTTGDDGSVSSSLGEGFGAPVIDVTEGFGEGDLSDDVTLDDADDGFEFPGEDGDGLTDAEASNILEEILEDVFGDDGPPALAEAQTEALGLTSTEGDLDFDISD